MTALSVQRGDGGGQKIGIFDCDEELRNQPCSQEDKAPGTAVQLLTAPRHKLQMGHNALGSFLDCCEVLLVLKITLSRR